MTRILIVEDDQSFADALACAFRFEGYEALVAVTAEEGVRAGVACRPDVIVADWMLCSDLHGGEVCRQIHAAHPSVKSIVITGCADAVSSAGRWQDSVATVLEKPFHTEEIFQAVDRVLSAVAIPTPSAPHCPSPAPAPG
jgi:two-component system response regulator RegX3